MAVESALGRHAACERTDAGWGQPVAAESVLGRLAAWERTAALRRQYVVGQFLLSVPLHMHVYISEGKSLRFVERKLS